MRQKPFVEAAQTLTALPPLIWVLCATFSLDRSAQPHSGLIHSTRAPQTNRVFPQSFLLAPCGPGMSLGLLAALHVAPPCSSVHQQTSGKHPLGAWRGGTRPCPEPAE